MFIQHKTHFNVLCFLNNYSEQFLDLYFIRFECIKFILQQASAQEFMQIFVKSFEFFYNSLLPAKSWQDPVSIDGEEQNKKSWPYWGLNPQPPDHQSNALLTVLARNLSVACVNHSAFIKSCSIDF